MKKVSTIPSLCIRILIISGLVTGYLAITTTGPLTGAYVQNEQSTPDDKEQEPKQEVLKAMEAIPSSAQLTLDHQFFLLDVLPGLAGEDEIPASDQESATAGSKVLKILFRRIISPNAP